MQLQHFECDTVCGFMVQGYDRAEISKIAMDHAKTSHAQVDLTNERIEGLITIVDTESKDQ